MLQESFDLPTTQILSLYALSNYLATKPELSVSKVAFTALYFMCTNMSGRSYRAKENLECLDSVEMIDCC